MYKYYSFKQFWLFFIKKTKCKNNHENNIDKDNNNINKNNIDKDNNIIDKNNIDIDYNLPINTKKTTDDFLSIDKNSILSENEFLECFPDIENNINDDDDDINKIIKENNKIIENIKLYKIYIFDNNKKTYINISSNNIF